VTNNQPPSANCNPPSATRGFWALIVTQFQGAFSDNALKWLAIFLITQAVTSAGERDRLVMIVGGLFAVPFILFSMAGGFLADRFSKRRVILGVKVFEIFVMLLALVSLAGHQLYLTIFCVFLMGVHSAIFGPSKYGLLPELLPEKKLSWGNGVLEFGTFIAIIAGTVAGGIFCKIFSTQPAWSGVILIALAFAGLGTGQCITKVPAADPQKKFRANFVAELWTQVKIIRRDRPLWLALIGNTYFFFIAALIQFVIVIYAKDVLGISDSAQTSYLQAATAIGIGSGCLLAGFLSAGKIETGLIPLGAVGLTVCAALLGRTGISFVGVATNLSVLGFFRRLLHRADFRDAAIPSGARRKGRRAGGGKFNFLRRHRARVGGFWFAHDRPKTFAPADLPRHRRPDACGHDLSARPHARRAAAVWAVVPDAHHLPPPHRRARPHSRKGRRALRLQPRFLCRRAAAARRDRPAGALSDVQGFLREAVGETFCKNSQDHSRLLRAAAARIAHTR
jgi:MFS family permease